MKEEYKEKHTGKKECELKSEYVSCIIRGIGCNKTIIVEKFYEDEVVFLITLIAKRLRILRTFNQKADDSVVDKKIICDIIKEEISCYWAEIIGLTEDLL